MDQLAKPAWFLHSVQYTSSLGTSNNISLSQLTCLSQCPTVESLIRATEKPSITQPVLPREKYPWALLTTDSTPPVMAVPRSATAMFTSA
ncbi:hypothetical protein EYF80_004157 [Liparis tanakae]|uniref:Uncharacterized protein n=1 Tax=Liparis tanakae TaxID=230148 RepID=A0A4Z2J6L2_9TELE|nr:hypothetical protein EYF80_004157 [Liparis tanakae]